jgi:hypothetical protein
VAVHVNPSPLVPSGIGLAVAAEATFSKADGAGLQARQQAVGMSAGSRVSGDVRLHLFQVCSRMHTAQAAPIGLCTLS